MSQSKKIKIGIVGATGLVGRTFLDLLVKRNFPIAEIRAFASPASEGKEISYANQRIKVQKLAPHCFDNLDLVFFSAGKEISEIWAPQAVHSGAFAIDNSSAFRMNPNHLLVVPEVNGHLLKDISSQVIANPNCSTIQLVVALQPIAQNFGLSEIRVSSYQAVSGAGKSGLDELKAQENGSEEHHKFPRLIAHNVIPQIGEFDASGACIEENKIMNETRKIMGLPDLRVSAVTVRVPVLNGHSETVWFTTKMATTTEKIHDALSKFNGIQLAKEDSHYPTPREVSGHYDTYVGRVHAVPSIDKTWIMWVVADNLWKGAALNSLQIAEQLFDIPYQS